MGNKTKNWMFVLACLCSVLMVVIIAMSAKPNEMQKFDTSIIEANWCDGSEGERVRMVGAWWYADGVVEDEQGQLWAVDSDVTANDFLLLWIADNYTKDDVTDDYVIKVWREV